MSRSLCLHSLSDDELLERLSTLIARHRRSEAELVDHIAEVDARKLYLARACSSMFSYSTEVLHLSEHEAYLRITCARASRRFPVLLDMLADGRLHLSAIAKLAPHLTEENAEALLARAVHRSKREVEELIAEMAPRADVAASMRKLPQPRRSGRDPLGPDRAPGATASPTARPAASAASATAAPAATAAGSTTAEPAVLEPIAPARFKVQFTASSELREKLERAQSLLRHKHPDCDLAEVVDEAVTLLLGKLERRRFGTTDAPRKTLEETDTSATSRYVPAAVRRVVFARDGGQCTFVDEATGRRCSCTDPGRLEYHHTTPYARGSDHDPDRIRLLCDRHNQYQAELDFGRETMERHKQSSSRAREPQAAYGPAVSSAARRPKPIEGRQARRAVQTTWCPIRAAGTLRLCSATRRTARLGGGRKHAADRGRAAASTNRGANPHPPPSWQTPRSRPGSLERRRSGPGPLPGFAPTGDPRSQDSACRALPHGPVHAGATRCLLRRCGVAAHEVSNLAAFTCRQAGRSGPS